MPLVLHRQAHGHAGGAGHPDVCTRHRDRGFDREAVVRVLTDETYPAKVKADVAQAAAYGIQGVPFFVIDGTYGVSGHRMRRPSLPSSNGQERNERLSSDACGAHAPDDPRPHSPQPRERSHRRGLGGSLLRDQVSAIRSALSDQRDHVGFPVA